MAHGAHKAPDFLKISPFGLVPAIDDGGYTLADSNAILIYLVQTYAKGSHWMPEDPKDAAEVLRWLTVAADNVYAVPCATRLVKCIRKRHPDRGAASRPCQSRKPCAVAERGLRRRSVGSLDGSRRNTLGTAVS